MMPLATVALLFAFLLSNFLTPLMRRVAVRYGFIDKPDGQRKIQSNAVALGGGLVLIAITPLVVVLMSFAVGEEIWSTLRESKNGLNPAWGILGLTIAIGILAVVGVIDDARGMRGSYKLFWQFVAVMFVAFTGLSVPAVIFMGVRIPLGPIGNIVSVCWLLAAINSFNLIDGIDGLAGSVGVVFAITFGTMAIVFGQLFDAIMAFALAGALLGFLRFNYSPAVIYLGDTGSMFIGLMLGAIALRCSMKEAATVAFSAPLAIWSIPILDSLAAIIRRKLTGKSIYATDRGHLHHVLLTKGLGTGQTVAMIAGLCAITCLAAVSSIILENDWIGPLVVFALISLLVFTRMFGYSEFVLVSAKMLGLGRLIKRGKTPSTEGHQTTLALQGERQWEELWGALIESAERFHLVKMRLNISLPRLHEEFYAAWQRPGKHPRESVWTTDIPLIVKNMPVGRLQVAGLQNEASASSEMSQFIDFVESLEVQLATIIAEEFARQGKSLPGSAAVELTSTTPEHDEVDSVAVTENECR
ncbi:MAG: undecaprenyl/decaprenyl-phosphate alpha-N-acetylglucosaminyl 1-phosphate transferase [Planctomycetales bacterium]|nr:undecaprenyl/decaprenyl-phosphate alpha-N-acetylglucosaminyl 1-phosphate transferase [Planctomycetales bacterium]